MDLLTYKMNKYFYKLKSNSNITSKNNKIYSAKFQYYTNLKGGNDITKAAQSTQQQQQQQHQQQQEQGTSTAGQGASATSSNPPLPAKEHAGETMVREFYNNMRYHHALIGIMTALGFGSGMGSIKWIHKFFLTFKLLEYYQQLQRKSQSQSTTPPQSIQMRLASPQFYVPIINTVNSYKGDTCYDQFNGGYKNCTMGHLYIYYFAMDLFKLFLEWKINGKDLAISLFEGNKDDVDTLEVYLTLICRLLGFTSMSPMEAIANIKNYINSRVGRELITLDCPSNGQNINYTCGRGAILQYVKDGKQCISISNTVSNMNDNVAFNNYESLQSRINEHGKLQDPPPRLIID
jgi:hypothetical protein